MALVAACGSFQICSADEEPPTNRLVFSKTFENIADNSWSNLEFPEDAQPPGLYYIELTELEGTVGCWGSQNNPYEDGPNGELLIAWRDGEPMLGNTDSDFRLQYRPTTSDWVELIAIAPQGAIGPSWTPFGLQDAEESIGQTFIALEEFTGVGLHTPTWNTNSSACTISLYAAEVQKAELAADPSPADAARGCAHEITLSWTPGEFAVKHTVYLSTDFADVNDGSASALIADNIDDATVDAGVLAFDQTYYWRVDEVNGAPDYTIFKGETWSFTVEPYAYPITNLTVTASGEQATSPAIRTIDGSGLDALDQHGVDLKTMWATPVGLPAWIQYTFDKEYKLHELWVWNANSELEMFMGFGAKDVTIEYSTDAETWNQLENVPEFAQGTGKATYTANTTVDLGEVMARHVRLTINAGWGATGIVSLSEVRFFYTPVQAFEPTPADGATAVGLDATLNWRPGREAVSHDVYFGADANAVAEGTVAAETVTDHSYTPPTMDFGTTYYWKVDEVGDAETYAGELWSFMAQEFEAIDDFESYDDDIPAETTIWHLWIDGLTDSASGSQVGYTDAASGTFGETGIVHGGRQSMPLQYDNTSFAFSEATRTFDSAQNWTVSAADTLSLYYRGSAPGFAETPSGSILMNGTGADIWGTADAFRFAYKSLSGNGTMVARVMSIGHTNDWAKGGVMIRQSTDAGSTHAFMPITPGGANGGNGASFQRRLTAGGDSTNDDSGTVVVAPYWVKIERVGNDFSGYISPDGVTWTQLGAAQTIVMSDPVLIGLALCSHDAALITSAEFSDVSTTGNVTGAWQVAEIGLEQVEGNSIESMYLTVKDTSGNTETMVNPDTLATAQMSWTQWTIPLSDFISAGVKMNAVKSITIGVGDKSGSPSGGSGILYVDDIAYGRSAQ